MKPAWIAVENGAVFEGRSVGADGEATGDLVFNTAMSGYHEILTDPSYSGQVVIMTYPLIGNYGVPEEDAESDKAWAEAFVMREMSSVASNFRSNTPLPEWLKANGIVAIDGVDTRKLTRITRDEGSLRCIVSTTDSDRDSLVVLSTGFGKSLCFQLPAAARPGLTIVLTPLIALADDQIGDLEGAIKLLGFGGSAQVRLMRHRQDGELFAIKSIFKRRESWELGVGGRMVGELASLSPPTKWGTNPFP